MPNKVDFKKLLDFSKGKYSYNDYLEVKKWFNEVDDNKETREQLFAQFTELVDGKQSNDESLHHIFEKIQYTILLEEKRRNKKPIIWNIYRQAAAILIIPVLAFSLWYYFSSMSQQVSVITPAISQSWVEINAPEGARVKFLLPDSTMGWLNSGSKLRYPPVFSQHRKVELMGEAYFEVKHKDQSDFMVDVADMDIKVLGTIFNVSAYSDDSFTYVVLEKGKVEINGKTGAFNYTLLPNERISFNRDSKSLNLKKVDAKRFAAWKDGYLIIENEPLGQVVRRIERWYNSDFDVQDEVLKKYRFKATFRDEPLEEVLRLIALTTPIIYNIEKREVDTTGILLQRKVTISLKK